MEPVSPDSKCSAKRYKGEGRISFLANQDKIRELIEAGWPLQAVFDLHQDVLGIKYMQFHRYVRQYIKTSQRGAVTKPIEGQHTNSAHVSNARGIKQFVPGPKNPDPKDLW